MEKKEGVTPNDVLQAFPGARSVSKFPASFIRLRGKSYLTEGDWLEIPEADRQAILEEASHWVLEGGTWRRTDKKMMGPLRCPQCGENPRAKVVRPTWSATRWDWMCHKCGRTVEK
jgi:hypothetical protein